MSNPAQLLDDAYPQDVTTADISSMMPARSSGAFSSKAQPSLADILRQYQGGMLTPEQMDAGYDRPARDILDGIFPSAQKATGTAMGAVPDPVWYAAAFIGPKGAANLAKAGIRKPDDWGGIERLRAAREHPGWKDVEARPSLWEELGWVPGKAWGAPIKGSIIPQPATVVPTPDMYIKRSSMSKLPTHLNEVRGNYGELVGGVDDLLTAVPALANLTTAFKYGPEVKVWGGVGHTHELTPSGRIQRWNPEFLEVHGNAPEGMLDTLRHETTHAAGAFQDLVMTRPSQRPPLNNTQAYAVARDEVKLAKQAVAALSWGPRRAAAITALRQAESKLADIADYAGYLHVPQERMAREVALRGKADLQAHQQLVPGLVDTYNARGLGISEEDFLRQNGMSIRSFEPLLRQPRPRPSDVLDQYSLPFGELP